MRATKYHCRWSGDDALVPIPRDGGHRVLLFVHDRPQARGLAAARSLYEANAELESVKVRVRVKGCARHSRASKHRLTNARTLSHTSTHAHSTHTRGRAHTCTHTRARVHVHTHSPTLAHTYTHAACNARNTCAPAHRFSHVPGDRRPFPRRNNFFHDPCLEPRV